NATIADAKEAEKAPGNVILVVSPQIVDGLVERLRSALGSGAMVLILEDFDGEGFKVARELGVRVETYPAPLLDPMFYYKDYFMPRVRLGNVTGYFNYGTAFSSYEGKCIGQSSPLSFIDMNLNGAPDPGEPSGEFCVAVEARVGRGRLVVLADSSIMINSMVDVNRNFIMALVGDGGLSLVSGLRFESLQSRLRAGALEFLGLAIKPPMVYVSALSSLLVAFLVSRFLAFLRAGGREIDIVGFIVLRHPGWSVEKLKRLLRDLYGSGESEG
ncbi:MAG: hypothetical protein QXI22_07230, partial [Sulfolobales archaeon]